MKKSLIALAALAAVSAASAQSSVTLYGVVDIGYGAQKSQSRDGTQSFKTSGVMDGANAGNRIGFRGTEDLGGGLKANFVVEQGISPTSGALFAQRAAAAGQQVNGLAPAAPGTLAGSGGAFSASTNRQSYLGLSSASFGTFNIGYQYTNMYELATLSGYNIGTEGMPGANRGHLTSNTGLFGGTRANGMTYISPVFGGGFTVRAQYGSIAANPETAVVAIPAVTETSGRRMGLMGAYANGPLSVSLGFTTVRSTVQPAVNPTRTANLTQIGASYDFGVVKLAGTYLTGKDGGVPTSLTQNSSYRAYQIGLSAPFGAIVPFITVGKATIKENSTGVDQENTRQSQIGVRYSLSKRTTAYAFYGVDVNSAFPANPLAVTRDSKTIVGVQHSF